MLTTKIAYPAFGKDWRKRWVRTPTSDVLHRLATGIGDWEADDLIPIGGLGTTACGVTARLGMPGVFSRMGALRCKRCCRKVGIPDGRGAPFNELKWPKKDRRA